MCVGVVVVVKARPEGGRNDDRRRERPPPQRGLPGVPPHLLRPRLASAGRSEVLVEGFGWCAPAECLSWSAVERGSDGVEVIGGVSGEVCAFREVLAEQAVGVLIGAALPWALRVGE